MIVIHATGFIGDKPELQYVGSGQNRTAKVEFDVVSSRRAFVDGEWKDVWERATFMAWGDEARRCAELFEKHSNVTCYGEQETSSWLPQGSTKRMYRTRYRLTGWSFTGPRRSQGQEAAPQRAAGPSRDGGDRRQPAPADAGTGEESGFDAGDSSAGSAAEERREESREQKGGDARRFLEM